jgi:hypothetical protein
MSSEQKQKASSPASAVLCGEEIGRALLKFRDDSGSRLSQLADLKMLEAAYKLSIASPQSFEQIVSSLRLVEKLSPDPTMGRTWKAKNLETLCQLLTVATTGHVLLLRNLPLTSITQSNRIWAAVEAWEALNQCSPSDDSNMIRILENSLDPSKAIVEWRSAILTGFANALRAGSSEFIGGLWRWLKQRHTIAASLFDQVPIEQSVEARIAGLAPDVLSKTLAEDLMQSSVSRNWLRLHGAVASAAFTPIEAVRRQLSVDLNPGDMAGLRLALRKATPNQILACACELEDLRLVELASETVSVEASLLRDVDFSSQTAQAIWAQALQKNPAVWKGPTDPQSARDTVLNQLSKSEPIAHDLLRQISASPLADLTDFPQRSTIWPRLDSASRDGFLRATALGWLTRLAAGSISSALEPDLAAKILLSHELDGTLVRLIPRRIGLACQAVKELDGLDESRFLQWLQILLSRGMSLDAFDSASIGQLIMERNWNLSAQELASAYRKGRNDIMPAIRQFVPLLDIWNRIFLKISSPSENEAWELFESVAVELYETGPDHNELWARAGGKNSDLKQNGNGQAR